MVMETLKKFLVSLLQPERANDQAQPALPLPSVLELPLLIMADPPVDLSDRRYPLHEAALFIKLPDLATLTPDQALAWREVLRWELEVLSQAYRALDPHLEGLDWITETVD